MPRAFSCALGVILAFALASCGYRLGQGCGLARSYSTITIPFVEGDRDGDLTSALIREMTHTGVFQYRSTGGQLILKVRFIDLHEENVGFRYDRNKKGKLKHSLIPTETRVVAVAEVQLVDVATGCRVLGPVEITGKADFDHDYYSSRKAINVFSLGQLTDIEAAREAVQRPLNQELARKIVDYVISAW